MKLYEINEQLARCFDEETGELISDHWNELNLLKKQKLESISLLLKNKIAEAEALKKEKQSFERRQRAAERIAKWCRETLTCELKGERFETPLTKVYFSAYDVTSIPDINKLPGEYVKHPEPEPMRAEILAALRRGEQIPGATLEKKLAVHVK